MLMKIQEVAEELRVSKTKVKEWIDADLLRVVYLPGSKQRKHRRILRTDLDEFLESWKSNKDR